MNEKTLNAAEDAAKEFLSRVATLKAAAQDRKAEADEFYSRLPKDHPLHGESYPIRHYLQPSKESAAVRRQSFELTRALADMRRPG